MLFIVLEAVEVSASKVTASHKDNGRGVVEAASAPAASVATPQLTPEMTASIEKFRHAIQLGMGQIVLATMNLVRYRNQTLADLTHLFVAPLLRDRVAIAKKVRPADGEAAVPAEESVVGIALWATVSDAVDARIAEQIKANVFPVRLAPEDWTSGDTVWLLDLIAADRKQATAVLANFRKVAGERPVRIAPLVARLIDPEVAERLRGARGKEDAKAAASAFDTLKTQGRA